MPTGVYLRPSATERFEAKYTPEPNSGCWLWTAACSHNGYPRMGVGYHVVSAHRWYYEQVNGPVPDELDLDHKCRVRCCVNPDHLEPVTRQENLARGDNVNRTTCVHGHLMTAANTYWRKDRPGYRECLTCRNERNAARAA